MLKADKLKLDLLKILAEGETSLGQLKRRLKIAHHYTLTNALTFLKELGLIQIKEKGDKLKSKVVRLK